MQTGSGPSVPRTQRASEPGSRPSEVRGPRKEPGRSIAWIANRFASGTPASAQSAAHPPSPWRRTRVGFDFFAGIAENANGIGA